MQTLIQHDDIEHLLLERTFNAPRQEVFKAWTDAETLAKWWGPEGFTNPVCEIDAQPQGAIRIDMKAPDGEIYPMSGTFREVSPDKIVFSSAALDSAGRAIFEVLSIVTFIEDGDRTRVTLKVHVTDMTPMALPYLDGMDEGWTQSFDRLESLLAHSLGNSFIN